MRVDVCPSDDYETLNRLLAAIAALGGAPDGDPVESVLGVGLHRFRFPDGGELSVFVDAWAVDAAGPDSLVRRVASEMAGLD